MSDLQTRPFSKNYSGLINQTVIGIGITVLCVTGHELMKRRRRGKALVSPPPGLGSRESWEFGYLYHGRSWARYPSPPSPSGWVLSWVKQAIKFPEDKFNELRGIDATLYVRFLRGCFWFALLHTLTTFPILFPIHVEFSENSVPSKSMTRASISSLVGTKKGMSLLWIHICLLFWITLSWIVTLFWICNGAFRLRAVNIENAAKRAAELAENPHLEDEEYYQHPHPQYRFKDIPSKERDRPAGGIRQRTVMVSNIPSALRKEKDLQEYFEYYMSRKVEKPSMGLTSSTQPGFLNKSFAFLFNRAKKIPAHLPTKPRHDKAEEGEDETKRKSTSKNTHQVPLIERVVVARKMTELASLLERREEILVNLETAHVKLANKTLMAVKTAIERRDANKPITHELSKAATIAKQRRSMAVDPERGEPVEEGTVDEEDRMNQLIYVLGPFVEEFETRRSLTVRSKKAISRTSRQAFKKLRTPHSEDSDNSDTPVNFYPPASPKDRQSGSMEGHTIWDALLSLPRSTLDAYQPLVNLSHLFRGQIVPSIDYYTAKLNLLTSLITENRAKAITDYDPVSTAFVTFADPADARRACKYLAVHPNNPLACLMTMAPQYQDIDWVRVMKSTYKGEFVKDWVVNIGVWAFTLFWLFPVSLLVGLVSIQNISLFWPSLQRYLEHHEWQSEVLQSFIPTLLVALLALLIPLILLLIAKKAHTITTLSALHDLIMTRYYKFLIVNVLVFFCVGTAAMQSFLQSFRNITQATLINVVSTSFPSAGPFYVGWLIFTTAMHGGFEVALLGLPLILYPTTSRQVTPRKRSVGIRPRTLNFYYWLPNHTLVIHVLFLFSVLNPFVLPFGAFYFFVQSGVIKNQLLHVYAKNYEADGRVLIVRIVRYSLDGLVLSQAIFLAYMVVLKKTVNVGLAAFLIVFTVLVKLAMTRMVRAQYEADDIAESDIICNIPRRQSESDTQSEEDTQASSQGHDMVEQPRSRLPALTWRLPAWVNFSYSTGQQRIHKQQQRPPIPFGSAFKQNDSYAHLRSSSVDDNKENQVIEPSHSPLADQRRTNVRDPESRNGPGVDLHLEPLGPTGPVVPHPSPRPWDDQTIMDLPYDNPFYSRMIDNALWLPRDPIGILDLDDTVDLKVAITVEEGAGRLGSWLGLGMTASPDEASSHSNNLENGLTTPQPPSSPFPFKMETLLPVDGTEEIALPPTIARRVKNKEGGVEQTVRSKKSGIFRRPSINGDKSNFSALSVASGRRPSILLLESSNPAPPTSHRSVSDGLQVPSARRGRSGSIFSTLGIPASSTADRAARNEAEFGTRPDVHAQAEFLSANFSGSRLSLAPPNLTRGSNVSTSQAIYHEVLEEERQALRDRLEEETAEAQEAQASNKSWLTSWMFSDRKAT